MSFSDDLYQRNVRKERSGSGKARRSDRSWNDPMPSDTSKKSVSTAASSLYSAREKHQPLHTDVLPNRSGRSRSALRTQQERAKRARQMQKYFFAVLCLILIGYLVALGNSLFRMRNIRRIAAIPHYAMDVPALDLKVQDRVRVWAASTELLRQAQTDLEEGNRARATRRLEELRRLAPNHMVANTLLAGLYEEAGRYADAHDLYVRVLESDPDQADIRAAWERVIDLLAVPSEAPDPAL